MTRPGPLTPEEGQPPKRQAEAVEWSTLPCVSQRPGRSAMRGLLAPTRAWDGNGRATQACDTEHGISSAPGPRSP